eukprot:XP_025007669.1 uncharacterized protein LOC112532690 [Gallus gallus]
MEPFQDAVVLTEDQGHPAPTDVCPHPATAQLACSAATLESGAVTTSADIPEDIADIHDLLAWLNDEVTSKTGILYDTADIDDLLTWINNEEAPSTDRLDNDVEIDNLLTWIDEAASALEVPQHNQDLPGVTREGTKDTANSCQMEELMQCITATEPLSPDVSSSLDSSSSSTEHSDSSRASRELNKHPGDSTEPAKCPAPACTTTKGKSTGHEQHTGSVPARKRKLPRGQDVPGHKHRR